MRNTRSLPFLPRRASRFWAPTVAGMIAVVLSGCTVETPPGTVQGALVGIGTASQQGAVAAWAKDWKDQHPGVSIAYSPDGAEVGQKAVINGLSHFAAGDSPLDQQTATMDGSACGPDGLMSIPVSVLPVGVVFNLEEVRDLRLDASLLAGILQGRITEWDDPQLAAANPEASLPSIDIVPILDERPSDVTHAVNKYLATEAPGQWPESGGSEWPSSTVEPAEGNASPGAGEGGATDLAEKVEKTKGAISFLDSAAIGSRFSAARLKFGETFQAFGNGSAEAAISAGATVELAPRVVEQRLDGSQGYALGVVVNQYFCARYRNEATADLVRSWGEAVLSRQGQKDAVVFSSSLPPSEKSTAAALNLIRSISAEKE